MFAIICLLFFPVLFFAGLITTIYKRYKDIQRIKKEIIRFQRYQKYFQEHVKKPTSTFSDQEDAHYEYSEEAGNDFTYDDHGNVLYGKGFVGAPRLPFKGVAINSNRFIQVYMSFDKKLRQDLLKNFESYYNPEFHNKIFDKLLQLRDVLLRVEEKQSYIYLSNDIKSFAKYFVDTYKSSHSDVQLSYFVDFLYVLYLKKAQYRLNYVLLDYFKKFFT